MTDNSTQIFQNSFSVYFIVNCSIIFHLMLSSHLTTEPCPFSTEEITRNEQNSVEMLEAVSRGQVVYHVLCLSPSKKT